MSYDTFDLTIDALGGRKRTIRVLTPETVAEGERLPVLYMTDGQNLFRDSEATFGTSWGFPATLEKLELRLLLVGWDSAPELQRLDELGPWLNDWIQTKGTSINRPVGGEAHLAVEFLEKQLKPLIDARYPTNPSRRTTWLAGSSMGGLFSLYAAALRPEVFSRAACFSSAFWVASGPLEEFLKTAGVDQIDKVYLDVGTMEGSRQNNEEERLAYLHDTERVGALLKARGLGSDRLKVLVDGGGKHNEAAWGRRLPAALKWWLADYLPGS
jgi:predicted alpha/beta superfamily hydrolase